MGIRTQLQTTMCTISKQTTTSKQLQNNHPSALPAEAAHHHQENRSWAMSGSFRDLAARFPRSKQQLPASSAMDLTIRQFCYDGTDLQIGAVGIDCWSLGSAETQHHTHGC
jgi:hypothetical protein